MNKFTFLFAVVVFFGLTAQLNAQNTFYVSPVGKGNGTSWTNAFGELQDALKKAKSGDQIWVAEGMYFPTTGTDRTISFQINDGVAVYGGFKGTEKNIALRDPIQNPTILSGNIGTEAATDNSYNVIYTKNVSAKTIADGFIVVGGNATYDAQPTDRKRSGGAWYNEGSNGGSSNPTIIACVFMDNFAKDGGALYNNGNKGDASPTLVDCTFQNNSCDLDGGALYNDGRLNGNSNPVLKTCKFIDNKANYGGAVFNYGLGGNATPTFTDCLFSTNNAYVKGGAVFHMSDDKLVASTMFGESVFNTNSALDHGSDDIHHYLISGTQMAAR
jgi:Chlamydia polymorphic membrane protein (Chlamydia_PMP) repeat